MAFTIIGQAVYQTIVLLVILFAGPAIFGIPSSAGNDSWNQENGLHFTIFFNTFVFMQLFNEINCRKLECSEWNVFSNFFNNYIFITVMVLTSVG